LSVPDFGNPNLLAMDIAVEKPVGGVVKLTAGILLGEEDANADEGMAEPEVHQRTRKSNPRMPAGDLV
jgi:hypothetical protein